MKMKYEKPTMYIEIIKICDVIRTSDLGENSGDEVMPYTWVKL